MCLWRLHNHEREKIQDWLWKCWQEVTFVGSAIEFKGSLPFYFIYAASDWQNVCVLLCIGFLCALLFLLVGTVSSFWLSSININSVYCWKNK